MVPYEILSLIGTGGMGEVYRATDTNLGREVAIKVLPEALAQDAERLARFEREAKTLASLNHPNIAIIHGLERADGVRALVMELVEGETLADRIARGPIPLDEALPAASQIAEALEAAHEHGIIHRDLKPANIKLRPDGTVKVLDFGLAKAVELSGVSSSVPQSPTITSPAMTRQGVILGTAAYMSPEQTRGFTLDRRTDIWAFGCVVYEMVTGRKPFDGDTVQDAIAAILGREADWSALPSATPPAIERLLRRCLQKDRRHRLADASDARLDIEEALATSVAEGGRPSRGIAPLPKGLAPDHRQLTRRFAAPMLLMLAVGVAVGVLATRAWLRLGASPVPWTPTFTRITDQPGTERAPSLSPDGKTVVYVSDANGNVDVYLLRVGGRNPVNLTADSPAADGNHLYFLSDRSGVMNLWRVPITENSGRLLGDPEALTTPTQFITGLSTGKNNALAFSAADPRSTVQRLDFDSIGQAVAGNPVVLFQSPRRLRWLDVSPDSKWILFSASGPGENLYVIGADGSDYRQITSGNALNRGGRWAPDGSRIYFYSNRTGSYQAWQVGFDGGGLRQLTNITGSVVLPVVSPRFDRFAFVSTTAAGRDEVHVGSFAALQEALKAGSAEARPTPVVNALSHLTPSPPTGFLIPSSWSPDGTLLAEFLAPPDGRLFVYSPKDNRHDDLGVAGQDPRWLPDGRRLLFHDSTRVVLLDVVNRKSRVIFQLSARTHVPNFGFALAPDGRHIVLVASEEPSDIWLMSFN